MNNVSGNSLPSDLPPSILQNTTSRTQNTLNTTSFFICVGHPERPPCGHILLRVALVCSLTVILMYPVYYLVSIWRRQQWTEKGTNAIARCVVGILEWLGNRYRDARGLFGLHRAQKSGIAANASGPAPTDLEQQKHKHSGIEPVDIDRTMRPAWMGGKKALLQSQKCIRKPQMATRQHRSSRGKENMRKATASSDEVLGGLQQEVWISGDRLSVLAAKVVYKDASPMQK